MTLRGLMVLVALGAAAAGAGAAVDPHRMWASWLLVSYYALTLALGGLCFVAVHDASGGTWGVAIRPAPEALAALIPFAAIAIGIAFAARPQLYAWTAGDSAGAAHGALAFKESWLQWPFFVARSAAYALIWTAFAWAMRRRHTAARRRIGGVFLAAFAVTFSLASFDWIMSLEPAWYSSIFGVYHFAGLFLSSLAAIVVVALWLERAGPLRGVLHDGHLHDLGKLMFAFSTFWAYIWFSQYMLIWYANLPEETSYFIHRHHGAWFALFVLNVVLNWVIPFSVLMARGPKRNRRVLLTVAAIVLTGRWLDLYLMILPPVLGEQPRLGLSEAGLTAAAAGAVALAIARTASRAPIVAAEDPDLQASLHYESSP